jgi:hypothetical protein
MNFSVVFAFSASAGTMTEGPDPAPADASTLMLCTRPGLVAEHQEGPRTTVGIEKT